MEFTIERDGKEIVIEVTITSYAVTAYTSGLPESCHDGDPAEWEDDFDGELTDEEIDAIQEMADREEPFDWEE